MHLREADTESRGRLQRGADFEVLSRVGLAQTKGQAFSAEHHTSIAQAEVDK